MRRAIHWTGSGLLVLATLHLSGCGGNALNPGTVARIAFLSDRTGNLDIWVVNSANGALFNVSNHSSGDDAFSWSPTGSQLAFLSNRSGAWELWVINVNGTGATQLTSSGGTVSGRPAWSPAGNLIAYEQNNDIWVYNLSNSTATNLTAGNGNNMMPCWSPSGTQIAFASDRGGNWDIWVMNANGTGVTQLTSDPLDEFRPVWSPNGQKIAFERGSDVWVMDANGANPLNLTNGVGTINRWATWSPNSQSIAFERDGDIYRIDANGTGLTQLTSTGDNFSPHWSKSYAGNSFITFMSSRSGNPEIYIMAPNGTGVTNLSNHAAVEELPVWSP
ncbi:MAG: DPP IV N-terminal domain-containing protein [Fimbriimonadales bacterium]|nr:MAG: hypothetical protein KatS3mg018_1731 [Fimbriimonadales bacterium]